MKFLKDCEKLFDIDRNAYMVYAFMENVRNGL